MTAEPVDHSTSLAVSERRKLRTQLSSRVLALVCALGPVVFSAALARDSASATGS